MKKFLLFVCFTLATMLLNGCVSGPMTAQDLFDRHISESYGPNGLTTHSSVTLKGQLVIAAFGITAPVTLRQMAPDSTSMVTQVMGTKLSNGCKAGDCWAQQPGQGVETLDGERLKMQLQQADYYQLTHMADFYQSLEIVAAVDGAESANHHVLATRENGSEDSYFFSKESGFLVSTVLNTITPQGTVAITTNSSNFQDYDGIKLAAEIEQVTPQVTVKIVIEDVSFAELSAADFVQ